MLHIASVNLRFILRPFPGRFAAFLQSHLKQNSTLSFDVSFLTIDSLLLCHLPPPACTCAGGRDCGSGNAGDAVIEGYRHFVIDDNGISDSFQGGSVAQAALRGGPCLHGRRYRSCSWPPARVRARVRAGAGGPAAAGEGSGRSASPEKPSSRCISMPRRAQPPRPSCRPRACEREQTRETSSEELLDKNHLSQ